jgi:hypothetical protein
MATGYEFSYLKKRELSRQDWISLTNFEPASPASAVIGAMLALSGTLVGRERVIRKVWFQCHD